MLAKSQGSGDILESTLRGLQVYFFLVGKDSTVNPAS